MKDLFVLTADADAQAVMRAVLSRPESLGICRITFDVDRHPMHDSGMLMTGPELTRPRKADYRYILLLWDHHGSGRETKDTPEKCAEEIELRLMQCTWKGRCRAIVTVPEIEEWLWKNTASIQKRLGVDPDTFASWCAEFVLDGPKVTELGRWDCPKERLQYVFLRKRKRTLSPVDFEEIAKVASLRDWLESESFHALATTLREWFPRTKTARKIQT